MVESRASGLSRRSLLQAAAIGVGGLAVPGLSGCSGSSADKPSAAGSVAQVEFGTNVSGITYPDGYVGPRATQRKPFGDGSKTFRVVVPQDSTIVGDWNTNKMTAWFEKATGLKVRFDAVLMTSPDGSADMTNVNAMLASGQLPDAFLGVSFSPAQLSLYGQQGIFLPISDYLAAAPGLRQAMKDYPDLKGLASGTDGKMYVFPGLNDCYHCRSSLGRAWISKSYLDKVGMKMPGTTDELRQVLLEFKNKNPSGKTGFLPFAAGVGNDLDTYFMGSFGYNSGGGHAGGWLRLNNGKVEFVANNDQWRKFLIYLNQLGKDGTLTQSAFTMTSQELTQAGNAGKIGFARAYWWGSFYNPVTLDANAPWRDYEPLPPLKGPEGTQIAMWDYYGYLASGLQITKACSNPEQLVQWADYQMDLAATMHAYSGVEGSNWNWAKPGDKGINGKQALWSAKLVPAPAGQGWNQYAVMYRSGDFRLSERVDPAAPTTEAGLYSAGKSYEPFAQPKDQQLPPVIIEQAEAAQVADTEVSIKNHVTQSMAKFALGQLDPNDNGAWDNYVKAFQDMNLSAYTDIYQKAYEKAPK